MSSISFEQRTVKSRGDYVRKALWLRGVLAEHLFSTLFSGCVSRYLFSFMHSAQLMLDSRSHDTAIWQASQESECKEFPSSSAYHHAVLCVLGCTRATLMCSMCSSRFPFWCGWCEASSDTGCEMVTGQSWNNGCYGHIQMVVVVVTLDTEPKSI